MAQARRLAAAGAIAILAGCGSSSPKPPTGGPTLRLGLPILPRTLDPAKVADLPSLNVAHELYAGLTRFSGRGVVPDLAESWEPSEDGLVWTFHLRKGIRWSDGEPITAETFRRAWLRALDPRTHSAYARAEMLNIAGARRYHATGSGEVCVEAQDDRTLKVTLRHPVPWLDQQVAYPVFFPMRADAWSGPFELVARGRNRLVLERNARYWNVTTVKPRRLVLSASAEDADAILPRGLAAPGFPWIATSRGPSGRGRRILETLSVGLLWFNTKSASLADPSVRQQIDGSINRKRLARRLGERRLGVIVPPAMPGSETITVGVAITVGVPPPSRLSVGFTTQDVHARTVAETLRHELGSKGTTVSLEPVATVRELLAIAPSLDMVLLGWSAEFFDAYNIFDLFPCTSALNVARWCDHSYDELMRRAVRKLDDRQRYLVERELVNKLFEGSPAAALYADTESVYLKPGVRGFRWSPIGFYELSGMTRS
jgi:oligopeptide transport system substrate-binding protein